MKSLIILTGPEGSGKTTVAKALLPELKIGASFDAENILQVNPFKMDAKFQKLAIDNSVDLIENFFEAGYQTVVAGSFIGDVDGYDAFRKIFKQKVNVYVLMVTATKAVRDKRRIKREKPSTKQERDWMEKNYPQDETLKSADRDYKYVEVDSSSLSVKQTIAKIKKVIPEVFKK